MEEKSLKAGVIMKICLENFGKIKYAEFSPNQLTVITGMNNSGKTYTTYAYYGFLRYWHEFFQINIDENSLRELMGSGILEIDLEKIESEAQKYLDIAALEYTENIEYAFVSNSKTLKKNVFSVSLGDAVVDCGNIEFDDSLKTVSGQLERVNIQKKVGEKIAIVSMFADKTGDYLPESNVIKFISNSIKKIVFSDICKNCFIASAERTGVSLFCSHLNDSFQKVYSLSDLKKNSIASPLPIRDNVNFALSLDSITKKESFLMKNDKEFSLKIADLLGGEYHSEENQGMFFVDNADKRKKFPIKECSSSVRSLLDISLYLCHLAEKTDLLIIDEPELNLHPEKQRKLARLLAYLSNNGLDVLITTHSDYILRELSNLILLHQEKPHIAALRKSRKYSVSETLDASKVSVYIAEKTKIQLKTGKTSAVDTLSMVELNQEHGILKSCFDDIIETQSSIMDEAMWGGE